MTKSDKTVYPKGKHIILYGNVIPVKGYRRSTLCDTTREKYFLVPNAMYDLLEESREKSIGELLDWAGSENKNIVIEYFDFLMERELAMITDEPELFPPVSLDYKTPLTITNAIIDLNENSSFSLKGVAQQLDDLGCVVVEIRCFSPTSLGQIEEMTDLFKETRLKSVEFIVPYADELTEENLTNILHTHDRLLNITVSDAPENKEVKSKVEWGTIHYVKQKIDSSACCGHISVHAMCTNMIMMTEAMNFNSCLHRKIGIDVDGNIKNCPSAAQSYGNLENTALREVTLKKEYTAKWFVTKDQVDICKDCEFRYLCTDCRVFTESEEFSNAKPSRCGYDPYQAKWVTEGHHNLKAELG